VESQSSTDTDLSPPPGLVLNLSLSVIQSAHCDEVDDPQKEETGEEGLGNTSK